jgi:hypothetical protein
MVVTGRVPLHSVPVALANATVSAAAFYGIHRRVPITWKLGWGVIVFFILEFIIRALSSTMGMPQVDHPWIARAAILIGGALVGLYGSFWWKRQESYFSVHSRDPQKPWENRR